MTPTADSGQAEANRVDAPVPPSRSLGQVAAFDGMRGIAVLIVFVAHMNVILPIPHLLVVPGATVSLDSFFVLSGFLITDAAPERAVPTGPGQGVQLLRPTDHSLAPRPLHRGRCRRRLRLGHPHLDAHREGIHLLGDLLLLQLLLGDGAEHLHAAPVVGIPAPLVALLRGTVLPGLAVGDDRPPDHPDAAAHRGDYPAQPHRAGRRPPGHLL